MAQFVEEDVGEARGDHAADAEISQRPGCVLARGAAAEIVADHEGLGVAVGRLVEDEIGILRAVVVVAHFREQALPQPGALDRLEILLGDDAVGIDVDDPHGRGDALQGRELFHRSSRNRRRRPGINPAALCAGI
ncbi:hypothetical protein M2440_001283 [Methylorubrum extorquens]|nr:hypothetical protein [Methylorubrum extorquens]